MIGELFNGALGSAWTTVKNAGRSVRGTTRKTTKAGEEIVRSPRQRLVEDLRKKDEILRTGIDGPGKYGNDWFERQGNRVKASIGIVKDHVFGGLGLGIGYGVKGAAIGGYAATKVAVPAVAKGTKNLATGAVNVAGDTLINSAGLLTNMAKSPYGAAALFAAPVIAGFGSGALEEGTGLKVQKEVMKMSVGEDPEQLPGLVTGSQRKIDTMGADGDLVFALHNLR